MMNRKKVGVIGATGYTGSEIVRILAQHPGVEIALITSESRAGEKFSDVHPFFHGIVDDVLHKADQVDNTDLDLVFLALPHGVSMDYVKRFAGRDFRMVDFSGDFRLASPEVYEQWYPKKHVYPQGFADAVYGLPELYADRIRNAALVANPGCFPTGAILSLAPLTASGEIRRDGIIIDSKTGVTGAGIKASATNMFSNVNDNFKAYGVKTHRHTIEIQSILEDVAGGLGPVQFTPHLLPVDRGILTTVYARPEDESGWAGNGKQRLEEMYRDYYRGKPFVRLCQNPPTLKDVRASNYCNIYVDYDDRTGNVIIISAIDNLVKGAAGLAVQNMNVMFGFDEAQGLGQVPINP
ncbi:N-acetyl-gamma-glutamyl-phosphate reductase [Balneolales bacterium ANBcel1]|nr:N-acetyl-gamma-glutamyl-phosphate reductase [Balneolales bacterium ANBcel1]